MRYRIISAIIVLIISVQLASGEFDPLGAQPGDVDTVKYHQFVITNASPIDFYPSDIKTINITIQNVFGFSAFDVSTVIDPDKADPIKFTNELQKYVGTEIGPNKDFTIQYEVYIKDTVPKGTYYIPLAIIWSSVKDGTVKRQENLFIGIKVAENPEVIKINTVNITTTPEKIKPGDVFKLKVTLKNIGNNKLNQIRAVLGVNLPFSSFGSSTEQYIPLLEPGQSAEATFNLVVDKQTSSRLYNFNFTLEYKDYTNRLQTQQSSFGINIEELSEVYIQDVILDPTKLNPGSEGLLMIQVANAGTNEIKNVRVTMFGGEKILTQTQNFIGIVRPGSTGSTSFGLSVDPKIKIGKYGLNIQVNFDDVNGQHHTKSNLYIVKIDEKNSIIPISGDTFSAMFFVFIFTMMSYGIFLVVGFRLDKKK